MIGLLAGILYALLFLLGCLSCYLLWLTFLKKKIGRNKQVWKDHIALLISRAIFSEEAESPIDLSGVPAGLLQDVNFRHLLITELLHIKRDLSGVAAVNLIRLYEQLGLDKDSFRKLQTRKGHIRARGLQELGTMHQVKYEAFILPLANNRHRIVRKAAQLCLLGFHGFEGLKFLDTIRYRISEWQQIQLLDALKHSSADDTGKLARWLKSSNDSVVLFALKLSAYYHCPGVYEDAVQLLQHPGNKVPLLALEYLKKTCEPSTPCIVVTHYASLDKPCRLLILEMLQESGGEAQIPFLLEQLLEEDKDIKIAAMKALAGIRQFKPEAVPLKDELKAIYFHLLNEPAA